MKIWDKGKKSSELVDLFTVGKDRELDKKLAKYDVISSQAHAIMLGKIGILSKEESLKLEKELSVLLVEFESEQFQIPVEFEDIHSYLEHRLTESLGELGKKIHTGRSRNDQVLVDLHLFLKDELKEISLQVVGLGEKLLELAEEHRDVGMPGYTHMQIAMPSSFGLWFSAYSECLADDLIFLKAAFQIADQNPLGSAAGYGSSFALDRKMTTTELGFADLKYNSIAAQLSRGKLESSCAAALASVASSLSKLSMDVVLFMNQNFGFITFPDELTTGSSIMPHKKNPDVFELIRAKCNKIQALPVEIQSIINNLPSGYHRDFQLLKESLFNALEELKSCLAMAHHMFEHIRINSNILEDEKYAYLYSVEYVSELVKKGLSFREAYVQTANDIESGNFKPPKNIEYSHEGSIGNLCLPEIGKKLKSRAL